MKAYVTSIGEPTTELCIWSLERNGFEVVLINNGSLLVDKLKTIYEQADDDFIRVDADIVPNKNVKPDVGTAALSHQWWIQFQTYDFHKQDLAWGGVQFIKKDALPYLRQRVSDFQGYERPETMLSRLAEFHNPRRFESFPMVVGINGFGQNDIQRIKDTKERRNQYHNYDFELAEKLMELV